MAVIEQSGGAPLDMDAVPPALRARAARANSAIQNIREGKAPDAPQEPAQQPQEGGERRQAPEQPREQQTPPQANSEPPKQEQPRQENQPQDWEQRFRTLQGKYDKETGEHRDVLRGLRQENDTLRDSLSAMEDRLRAVEGQQPTAPAEQSFDINKVLTEEELQDWGELAPVLAKIVAPLQAKIAHLEGKTQQREQRDQSKTREEMHAYLDKEVPDWESINKEEDFYKEWLLKRDEASGLSLSKLLQDAYSRNEAARVAYIFKRYLSEKGRASPDEQGDQGNGRAAAPKSLDQFAAPGKGRTATQPSRGDGEADTRRYPMSEYTAFLADKMHNRLRMTTAEIQQKNAEYERAYKEGRIDL